MVGSSEWLGLFLAFEIAEQHAVVAHRVVENLLEKLVLLDAADGICGALDALGAVRLKQSLYFACFLQSRKLTRKAQAEHRQETHVVFAFNALAKVFLNVCVLNPAGLPRRTCPEFSSYAGN